MTYICTNSRQSAAERFWNCPAGRVISFIRSAGAPTSTRGARMLPGKPRCLTGSEPRGIIPDMSTSRILSILEAAQIEPPKARAIAESLEIAFREQEDDLTKRLMTKQDGAEIKAEVIKWMFLFWIGQLAATAAIVKFLIR